MTEYLKLLFFENLCFLVKYLEYKNDKINQIGREQVCL
jgi:hypothetical protein